MSSEALVLVEPSSAELATVVRREHKKTQEAVTSALTHALQAGEALLAIRRQIPGGKWNSWLRENLPELRSQQVSVYMRLARYREIVEDSGVHGIAQAQQLLIGLPHASRAGARDVSPDMKAKAVQLVGEGMAPRAVAAMFGVKERAIRNWTQTETTTRNWEKRNERALKAKAELEEAKARAAKAQAKKRGGGIAMSYSLAERLQDPLGRAHREEADPEARRALSEAGELHRRMRDLIVFALGVSS